MSSGPFNAVSHPSDLTVREGVTHLMFAPTGDTPQHLVDRWLGLRAAIEKAGGYVQAIENIFDYNYARDLGVVVGDMVFHPTVPGPHLVDFRRRAFLPFLQRYGYTLRALNTLPDYAMDGGNFVPLSGLNTLVVGQHSIFNELDDLNMDALRAQRLVAAHARMNFCSAASTTWHIDSVTGELPDGRLLVKLDELDREQDLKDLGHEDAYLTLLGVKNSGLRSLRNQLGAENLLTFSLFDHPDADVVCGPVPIIGKPIAARAFGLAANSLVVNGTLIGEDLPAPLADRLKRDGIRHIGPKDVGVDTFVYGDEGFVGAARCLTLPVSPKKPRLKYF